MSLVPGEYYYYNTRRTASVPAFPIAKSSSYTFYRGRSSSIGLSRSQTLPAIRNLDYFLPYHYRPYGTWRRYYYNLDHDLYPHYWTDSDRYWNTSSFWPYYYYVRPSLGYHTFRSWTRSPLYYSASLYPATQMAIWGRAYGYLDPPYWRDYFDLYKYQWWKSPYSSYWHSTRELDRGTQLWKMGLISHSAYNKYWLRPEYSIGLLRHNRYWDYMY